ncbi:MAG: hypothetical protein LBF41_07780 [Deltaproteobacteria bacterium]|jgi:hypothetical protein|nr:hypothetical protein [Deltaproteobacteria bacterium]
MAKDKENKENQSIDQLSKDKNFIEKSDIFAIMEEMREKKQNMLLLKSYLLNYVEFIDNIDKMTADPDNFMTFTRLEEQMTLLNEKCEAFAHRPAIDKLTEIDGGVIVPKKRETPE